MAVDPRQIVAGVLTVTMFVMLGNMITRDHFYPVIPLIFMFYLFDFDVVFCGFVHLHERLF